MMGGGNVHVADLAVNASCPCSLGIQERAGMLAVSTISATRCSQDPLTLTLSRREREQMQIGSPSMVALKQRGQYESAIISLALDLS